MGIGKARDVRSWGSFLCYCCSQSTRQTSCKLWEPVVWAQVYIRLLIYPPQLTEPSKLSKNVAPPSPTVQWCIIPLARALGMGTYENPSCCSLHHLYSKFNGLFKCSNSTYHDPSCCRVTHTPALLAGITTGFLGCSSLASDHVLFASTRCWQSHSRSRCLLYCARSTPPAPALLSNSHENISPTNPHKNKLGHPLKHLHKNYRMRYRYKLGSVHLI
jgi:hypothetical protein